MLKEVYVVPFKTMRLQEITREIISDTIIGEESFMRVAINLATVRREKLYKEEGIANFTEYLKRFDYSKTAGNEYASIGERLFDVTGKCLLAGGTDNWSITQLAKMLPLVTSDKKESNGWSLTALEEAIAEERITPSMSCADIANTVTAIKEEKGMGSKRKATEQKDAPQPTEQEDAPQPTEQEQTDAPGQQEAIEEAQQEDIMERVTQNLREAIDWYVSTLRQSGLFNDYEIHQRITETVSDFINA